MKLAFELLTEPLGLPVEWYWEYIILAAIGAIAFRLAYRFVGDCQLDGFIGRVVHWSVRLIVFVILWATAYGIISLIKFTLSNWKTILLIVGIVLAAIALIILTLCAFLQIQSNRKDKTNK